MNPSETLRPFRKTSPVTGEVLGEYAPAGPAEVARAVREAEQAFAAWSALSPGRRAKLFLRLAALLAAQADELAALVSRETGKPLKDALEADVITAVSVLRYYAETGPRVLAPKTLPPDRMSLLMGRLHRERRVPLGVVAVISPWNYPLAIATSGMAAALMAGNTVVFKPSELAPGVGQRLHELLLQSLRDCGLPPEAVRLVQGEGETGRLLVAQEALAGVIFTGSSRVGRQVQQAMAARNRVCSLELGSSDPCVVLPGADTEAASSAILWGRFTNAGQACAAIKRVYVHQAQEAELLERLRDKMTRLQVGDPAHQNARTHVGPLISERQLETVQAQLESAARQGARVLMGGERLERPGYFMAPALVSGLSADSPLLREEVFGPVLPVVPYASIDEAVSLANDTPYGLTASVFGPDAEAVAGRLRFATVVINDAGPGNYAIPAVPWCGWRDSGPGTSHSEQALLEMTRRQVISANLLAGVPGFAKAPWYFSVRPGDGLARALLRVVSGGPLAWLHPGLAIELWKNRGAKKL